MKNFLNPAHKLVFLSAALLFMQKYIKISRIKRKCNQLSNRKKSKRLNSNNNNKKEREGKKKTEKQQLSEDFCSGSGGEKSQIVIGNLNNVLEYKMSLLQLVLQVLSEIQLSATFLSDLY